MSEPLHSWHDERLRAEVGICLSGVGLVPSVYVKHDYVGAGWMPMDDVKALASLISEVLRLAADLRAKSAQFAEDSRLKTQDFNELARLASDLADATGERVAFTAGSLSLATVPAGPWRPASAVRAEMAEGERRHAFRDRCWKLMNGFESDISHLNSSRARFDRLRLDLVTEFDDFLAATPLPGKAEAQGRDLREANERLKKALDQEIERLRAENATLRADSANYEGAVVAAGDAIRQRDAATERAAAYDLERAAAWERLDKAKAERRAQQNAIADLGCRSFEDMVTRFKNLRAWLSRTGQAIAELDQARASQKEAEDLAGVRLAEIQRLRADREAIRARGWTDEALASRCCAAEYVATGADFLGVPGLHKRYDIKWDRPTAAESAAAIASGWKRTAAAARDAAAALRKVGAKDAAAVKSVDQASGTEERPPLGVAPDCIWREGRCRALAEAVARRVAAPGPRSPAHFEVLRRWLAELAEHREWLARRSEASS